MPSRPHIVGVLVAAGRGRRMGTTKQLLPWPPNSPVGKTVIESAFDAIAPFCERMIVVFGHEAEAVSRALGSRRYIKVCSDPDAEMFDSIKAGLCHAFDDEYMQCVLLQPADHPEVRPATVQALLDRHALAAYGAVMPEYRGRGGHPVLIPRGMITGILEYEGGGGLRAYWERHPDLCTRLGLDDPDVARDLDTPDAYRLWCG